ncbi:MAG: flagellar hook-associated protein FlgK [Nitrosomonadales bacterium]|nr:flagellar hook-associated protein FlgK [Nitrosomonadales bacterium]
MGTNIFTSALSGMNAAQVGLTTTEHNIANASTPGFTRQEVLVGARTPQWLGGMFLGQGVDAVGVRRIYDEYLTSQVRQEQTQASYLGTYHTAIKQIDNLLADPAAGASPAINEFFNAMNGVANNPESIPARQTLLSGAQYVVNRFQAIDQRLSEIASGLNGRVSDSVNTINSYARQIANLNGSIKRAIGVSQGQPPNDLLDQRDQLINQLNQEIKVSVQNQSDGTISVHIGNGQTLVINEQTMVLGAVQSASDPSKLDVAYSNGNKIVTLQQSSFQGGNLGALFAFRDQSLEPARNAIGRVALGLADSVNRQNRLGQDLKGALGGDIFKAAAPRVDQGANNGGTAVVSATIADISAVTTSDYQLRFDGTNYAMVRLSDNTVTNLGATLPQTVDGIAINLAAGAAVAGDFFLIRPTANAARDIALATNDPARIAAAAPMRTSAALTNTGSGQISAGTVNTPPPTNINLQATVSIVFTSATAFTVSGAVPAVVGTVAYTPGQDISYNGWTAQISGTPATGDTFTIAKNTNAVGDSRNALLLAGMQTQNLLANGTTNFQGAYGQLVGDIGAKTQELAATSQAQANMVTQTVASQQAVSGVNLDEEAANLLRYQRAYQAAAKALQVASTMFDALLSLGK